MLTPHKATRQVTEGAPEAALTEAVNPTGSLHSDDYPWDRSRGAPEPTSNFIRGVLIALPLSITLWAGMILGLRAIF
jgi:hypothetical protein